MGKLKQVPAEHEARMHDLALQLMDAARAAAAATFGDDVADHQIATSVAVQTALQAVFSAEMAADRKKGEEAFVAVNPVVMQARWYGVGQGVGQMLGSIAAMGPLALLEATAHINVGLERAIMQRAPAVAERFRQRREGK